MASQPNNDASALLRLVEEAATRVATTTIEHSALVERQEVQRAEFSSRVEAEMQELEVATATLLSTRTEINTLRATAKSDAAAIIAAATAEADLANETRTVAAAAHTAKVAADERALHARLASMEAVHQEQEQAHLAGLAAHAATMEARTAAMEAAHQERELAHLAGLAAHTAATEARLAAMEAAHQDRERTHAAELATQTAAAEQQITQMQTEHTTSIATDRERFGAECAAKELHLETLEATERVVQARAAALTQAPPGTMVQLLVGGASFVVAQSSLAKHPQSMLALQLHARLVSEQQTAGAPPSIAGRGPVPMVVDGSPTHFQLICDYLRCPDGTLPVVGSASELRWLEKEAKFYRLDLLVQLCKDA
jgi:hypothetical protein